MTLKTLFNVMYFRSCCVKSSLHSFRDQAVPLYTLNSVPNLPVCYTWVSLRLLFCPAKKFLCLEVSFFLSELLTNFFGWLHTIFRSLAITM